MPSVRNVLPDAVRPRRYELSVEPDFSSFTFKGHVAIHISATKSVTEIVLNAIELSFQSVQLQMKAKGVTIDIPVDTIIFTEDLQQASIPLCEPFIGDGVLSIAFTGIINDKLSGFYRSTYTVDGKVMFLGTTQFEAVDARRAFPCWDEPACKAVFDMRITTSSHLLALSNMPHISKEEVSEGRTCWTYAPTPIMSTYLLAWVIGELECLERTIKKVHDSAVGEEETLVRVFAPRGKQTKGAFALDVACKVLPLYEKFFDINYVLPKLDMVAIPDFSAGAMENWGLITYREVALLTDEKSSAKQKEYTAIVVAHEIAHQWFGNLVTMAWWKELWLNESFATYVEYWAVNKLFPEWQVNTQFVFDEITRAFELDALRSSHPVEVEVTNAQDIDDIFDAISYAKGGSVLRMAVEFIGEDAFQRGISAYLKHFIFRNANTVELWKFLGQAAGQELTPILEFWTGRQGYPMLMVVSCEESKQLCISQHRFLATNDVTPEEDETVWQIPLMYTICELGKMSTERTVMNSREFRLTVHSAPSWVKLNVNQNAFCRVMYSEPLFQALLPVIESKAIGNIDRFSLLSDYHAFARGGYCSTILAMKLLSHYLEEDDYTVWCAVLNLEADVRNIVSTEGAAALSSLDAYCRKLYGNAMRRVGYEPKADDDHRITQLRALLFARMTLCGDEKAIRVATEMYMHRDHKPIVSDFQQTVFTVHVRENGRGALEEVKALAISASEADERARYLRALAATSLDGAVSELFDFVLSEKVRTQDALYLLGALASSTRTKALYVTELMNRWSFIAERFRGSSLGRFVKLLENGSDTAVLEKWMSFCAALPEKEKAGITRSLEQGLEGFRLNVAWAKRDAKEVVAFLSKQ